MKVLVTCPPMLATKDHFIPLLNSAGIEAVCPDVVQTLTEETLCEILPTVDGWIIGDDPATRAVFAAGKSGRLKAAVKWGIGTDNVDFKACEDLGIPISNTPGMFGMEVADIALGYVIALARETFHIDRSIRDGSWNKRQGISLADKVVGIVGYGDIGSSLATRVLACEMAPIVWDPNLSEINNQSISLKKWPDDIQKCDFLVFTCSLNDKNFHMFNESVINKCKKTLRLVNVARGGLIDQQALEDALELGTLHSAALDVFEVEPLPENSYLKTHPLCILGSHNSSNTIEAVIRTNVVAIKKLIRFLKVT